MESVVLYSGESRQKIKSFSRFLDIAYSGLVCVVCVSCRQFPPWWQAAYCWRREGKYQAVWRWDKDDVTSIPTPLLVFPSFLLCIWCIVLCIVWISTLPPNCYLEVMTKQSVCTIFLPTWWSTLITDILYVTWMTYFNHVLGLCAHIGNGCWGKCSERCLCEWWLWSLRETLGCSSWA